MMKQRWIVAGAGLALVAGVAAVGVIVASGDGAGTPEPIRLAAGGGNGGAATDEALAGPSKMMAPAGPLSFEVPQTLPVLDGAARAWVYRAGRPATAEQAAAVARALGLEGEPVAVPADQGGGWRIGPADGSGPSLSVSAGALGDFWYSRPDAYGGVVTCAVPETVGGDTVTDVCQQPTPPPGVPDAAGARAIADAFVEAAGQDPDAFDVEVYGDEYTRTVSYFTLLDGVRSPLSWYVTVGAEGMIAAAGGQLAEPEPVDDYPRIGTAVALENLQAGQPAPWLPVPMPLIAEDAATSGDASTGDSGASSDGGVASSDTGTAEVLPEPQPEPLPAPEPQVVQITGVEPSLWFADGADGEVWLLPAYAFLTADGGRWEAAAIDAGLVEVVVGADPSAGEPADATEPATEPGSAGTGVNSSDDGVVVSPDQPAGASIDPNAKPYPMPSPGDAPYPVTPSEQPGGGGQSPSDDG